jgi:hypothetical protein
MIQLVAFEDQGCEIDAAQFGYISWLKWWNQYQTVCLEAIE